MMNRNSTKTSQKSGNSSATIEPEKLVSEIKQRAQTIFEKRGGAPGSELDDWLKAEREVKARYGLKA